MCVTITATTLVGSYVGEIQYSHVCLDGFAMQSTSSVYIRSTLAHETRSLTVINFQQDNQVNSLARVTIAANYQPS